MIKPFCHFSAVSLSLCYNLFVLKSALLKYSPLHVHEYFHSTLSFSFYFSFLLSLFNCLLSSHRLNQDFLLVVLGPLFGQIYIMLYEVIFISTTLKHDFQTSLLFQLGEFFSCLLNCIFLTVKFVDALVYQIPNSLSLVFILSVLSSFLYSLG